MGPLQGIKVIEVGGIGPGPFCAMMLSDMGAEVIRIDRRGQARFLCPPKFDILHRGRKSLALDLTRDQGVAVVLRLVDRAEILIEGFRPGVMEKLGLGPDVCLERNPRLVYGRMTGFGQDGPLSRMAGHDLNFIALSGALHAIGRAGEKPVIPLNLVGDFGGGGMVLAFGLVCALLEAQRSGQGQVVDASMVEGAALLMSMIFGLKAGGLWADRRGTNLLDGGAPFYDSYETADGAFVAIAAIEPQFYARFLTILELEDVDPKDQYDVFRWGELKDRIARAFRTRTRDQWCDRFAGQDACFSPVLSLEEAPGHPHTQHRKAFVPVDGVVHPAPAPRFSRTPPQIQGPAPEPGKDNEAVLKAFGFDPGEIQVLRDLEVI